MRLAVGAAVAAMLVLGGCLGAEQDERRGERAASSASTEFAYPPAPPVPSGALDTRVEQAASRLVSTLPSGALDAEALEVVARSRDPRLGWLLSDMLRFTTLGREQLALVSAFGRLTGAVSATIPGSPTALGSASRIT